MCFLSCWTGVRIVQQCCSLDLHRSVKISTLGRGTERLVHLVCFLNLNAELVLKDLKILSLKTICKNEVYKDDCQDQSEYTGLLKCNTHSLVT